MSSGSVQRRIAAGGKAASAESEAEWLRRSIDLIASLAEEVHFAEPGDADEAAFAAARTALQQLDFSASGFAVPDLDGLEFRLRLCDPAEARPRLDAELSFQVSKGRFGWALRQNRPVLLASSEAGRTLLLQPLATRSRVIGVFLGLIDEDDPVIPVAYRKLISHAFFHFASVIECAQLSKRVDHAKELVAKRSDEKETGLRRAQDILASDHRQANRMLEELGRELQTPASGISGLAARLLGSTLTADDREAAQAISGNASLIVATLSDLATWCRLASGSLADTRRDFSPIDVVAQVQDEAGDEASRKGVALTSQVDPGLPHFLRGDPERLRQILHILTRAALGASKGGEVSIRAYEMSNSRRSAVIRFEVHATGAQVDAGVADHFFEPFDNERSLPRGQDQSGLRIALCKALVESLQGQVGVVALPGLGTRFWCNLQLKIPTEDTPAEEPEAPALQVLLLCSEGRVADRLDKAMKRRGHHVARQLDGQELPDPKRFDILVLGSLVDGGPWAHLCRKIRRLPGGRARWSFSRSHTRRTLRGCSTPAPTTAYTGPWATSCWPRASRSPNAQSDRIVVRRRHDPATRRDAGGPTREAQPRARTLRSRRVRAGNRRSPSPLSRRRRTMRQSRPA